MAVEPQPDRLPSWDGSAACPFCGALLADGGPGFIDHVRANRACRAAFDTWRERAADDIHGGWPG